MYDLTMYYSPKQPLIIIIFILLIITLSLNYQFIIRFSCTLLVVVLFSSLFSSLSHYLFIN
jgi:hypothetical protein